MMFIFLCQDRFKDSGVSVRVITAFGDELLSSRHMSYPLVLSFAILSTVERLSADWDNITVLIGSKQTHASRVSVLSNDPVSIDNTRDITMLFKYSQPKKYLSEEFEHQTTPIPKVSSQQHVYDVRFPHWNQIYSSNSRNDNVLQSLIKQVHGTYRTTHLESFEGRTLCSKKQSVPENLHNQYVAKHGLNTTEYTIPFTVVS